MTPYKPDQQPTWVKEVGTHVVNPSPKLKSTTGSRLY